MLALSFLLMIGMTLIADGVGVKVPKATSMPPWHFLWPGRGAEHAVSPRGAGNVVRCGNDRADKAPTALKLTAMKLKDRVAIVTGGASGIGAASARLFAAEGAKLKLVDQDEVGLARPRPTSRRPAAAPSSFPPTSAAMPRRALASIG